MKSHPEMIFFIVFAIFVVAMIFSVESVKLCPPRVSSSQTFETNVDITKAYQGDNK